MKIYVDIDETICFYESSSKTYADAVGHKDNIDKIVDSFYDTYRDTVAADPRGHAMDYVHIILEIEKMV